jgi:hypothetical protein
VPTPYAPPKATVRDLPLDPRGPLPNWVAVLVGLITDKILTVLVADELSSSIAVAISSDVDAEHGLASLIIDLALTFGGELFAFWITLRLCRSRSFRVVSLVAVISWAITLGDRWLLADYGWPFWYEIALLCVTPLAFLSLYGLRRQQDVVA